MLERRHGYTRTPAPIIQAEPKTIDITTTEGQVAALEILNQIPVALVAQMNRKRLEAALQTPVEPNQQPKHQLEERWENCLEWGAGLCYRAHDMRKSSDIEKLLN